MQIPRIPERIDIAHPEEWGVFALVIVAALVLLYYLLRVTLSGARRDAAAVLPAKPYHCVLMPTMRAQGFGSEAVTLACQLASPGAGNGRTTVVLSYVIEVPRSLPLDASLPEEEAEAERVLQQAAEDVRQCGLKPVTQVRKTRSATEETLRAVEAEKADLLVLTPTTLVGDDEEDSLGSSGSGSGEIAAELARRAPCEVVLARAMSTSSTSSSAGGRS